MSEVLPGVRCLTASAELEVRFSEVDAQGVVWHGNYLRYLELARSAMLALGGLRVSEIMRAGYVAPIVECDVRYRSPLRLEERVRVEAELLWQGVPRFDFVYRVVRLEDGVIAATATTRQVVLGPDGALVLVLPPLLVEWEKRCGLGR